MCSKSVAAVFCVTIVAAVSSVPQNNGLRAKRAPIPQGPRWAQGPYQNPRRHHGPYADISGPAPPMNRGPPSNRGPPENRGPPANRGPPDNRGPPSNRGPPNNRGPPANKGPPDNRGPPGNRRPMDDLRPPQNQGTLGDKWQPSNNDSDNLEYNPMPVNIGDPINKPASPNNPSIAGHTTNKNQGQALANNGDIASTSIKPPIVHFFQALPVTPEE